GPSTPRFAQRGNQEHSCFAQVFRWPSSSYQNVLNHFAGDVGEAEVSSLKLVCQSGMIDPETVQDRCLQVMVMDRVPCNVVGVVIGLSKRDSRLNPATCHPDRKALLVMIPPVVASRYFAGPVRGATEFARPDHQGLFQQSALP